MSLQLTKQFNRDRWFTSRLCRHFFYACEHARVDGKESPFIGNLMNILRLGLRNLDRDTGPNEGFNWQKLNRLDGDEINFVQGDRNSLTFRIKQSDLISLMTVRPDSIDLLKYEVEWLGVYPDAIDVNEHQYRKFLVETFHEVLLGEGGQTEKFMG